MPSGHVRVSGTWKGLNKLYVKVGGTWKEARKGYIKVAGAWKLFHRFGEVVINGGVSSHDELGVECHSGITFGPNGQCYDLGPNLGDRTIITSGEWWSGEPDTGIGANYDVRYTSLSGTAWDFQEASINTWVNCSTEAKYRTVVTIMNPGTKSTTATFEISETTLASALDSASYTATCNNV
jgi:hypothetical protein